MGPRPLRSFAHRLVTRASREGQGSGISLNTRSLSGDANPLVVASSFTNLNGGGYPSAFGTGGPGGFLLATSARGASALVQVRAPNGQRVLADETVGSGDLVLTAVSLDGHAYILATQTRSFDSGSGTANVELKASSDRFQYGFVGASRLRLVPNPYRIPDCP